MKKLLAMLLAMVMVFSLAACAQGGTTNGVSATEKTAAPDNNGEKDSSTSTGDSDSIDVGDYRFRCTERPDHAGRRARVR